ncbi:MAG TPA: dihydroorotate dehydrogenase [Lactobacillus sp.]|nr:dihydroorotate dehydrogenase [Lactobacillus sp.]
MENGQSVHQLNNDYVKKLRQSEQQRNQQKTELSHRRRNRALRILAVFALIAVLSFWAYEKNMASLNKINQQNATTSRQLKAANTKNGQLTQQVKQLHNDAYLTQLIRDKYLYSKNGEIVYNLPKNSK